MRDELDKALCEKYPKIFRQRHWKPEQTAMCWGFPDDGWFTIIDTLCMNIQHYIDNHYVLDETRQGFYRPMTDEERDRLQVVAVQVKEKFGGLRFYYEGGDRFIEGLVQMAQSMSYKTCEFCGNVGEPRGGGWIKTLCIKCNEERK